MATSVLELAMPSTPYGASLAWIWIEAVLTTSVGQSAGKLTPVVSITIAQVQDEYHRSYLGNLVPSLL